MDCYLVPRYGAPDTWEWRVWLPEDHGMSRYVKATFNQPRKERLTPRASDDVLFAKFRVISIRKRLCAMSSDMRVDVVRFLNQTGGRMVRQNGVDVDIAVDRLQHMRNKDSGWFAIARLLLECNQTMARYLEENGNE